MRFFIFFLFAFNLIAAPALAQAASTPPAGGASVTAPGTAGAADAGKPKPTVEKPAKPPEPATAPKGLSPDERTFWAITSILALTAALLALAYFTDVLRDALPTDFFRSSMGADPPVYARCYSLARTQMVWWFWIVTSSFLYIVWNTPNFLTDGFKGGLTQQSLGLMGIGMGTGLGAAIIEQSKKDKAGPLKALGDAHDAVVAAGANPGATLIQALKDAAQALSSDGFFRDILSDAGGISMPRFQSFAWTLVLGIVFLFYVYYGDKMPEFSAFELSILGMSAGLYLGFKIPEQQ